MFNVYCLLWNKYTLTSHYSFSRRNPNVVALAWTFVKYFLIMTGEVLNMARSLRAAYDVYVCAVLCVLFPLCTPEKNNERKKHGQKRRGRRAACQRNNANFITSTYFPIFIIVRISKQLKLNHGIKGLSLCLCPTRTTWVVCRDLRGLLLGCVLIRTLIWPNNYCQLHPWSFPIIRELTWV